MRSFMLMACLAVALPAAAQNATVAVTEAWSRASTGQTGAIYVTVTASEPDRLTAASTPAAAMVEVHQSRMTADGVMEMRPVTGGLAVAPGTPIHMVPGGYHIMLMGLKQPLKQGDHLPVTLTFDHAGAITADVIVAGPGASSPSAR